MARATGAGEQIPGDESARRGMRSASAPPTGESSPIGKKAPAAITTAQVALSGVRDDQCPDGNCLHPGTDDRDMPPDHNRK